VPKATATRKLAASTVDRVVDDIAAMGWPEGEILGSEADLLERYGVSRAVFREAVRLLEHLQVARMRQGPGGGLMVLPPTVDSVTDAVSVYLFYVGAELDEVFEARQLLEVLAVELAVERLGPAHLETMRASVAAEQGGPTGKPRALHKAIAEASGNPALSFFVDLLNRTMLLYLPRSAAMSKRVAAYTGAAHEKILDSIASGDTERAKGRMRKHLNDEAEFLRENRPSLGRLADLPDIAARSEKRGEQTARQIFREVAAAGWQVGALLGSEAELMRRHDVSRAVLREAVRVLEHHQIARMRRGPGGGLFVVEPGIGPVTDAIALQVDRLGIAAEQLSEVRSAVARAGAGNRVIELLALVLNRLDELHRAA
jgi:DNA-binding FadR family transcriptional regulator